jgi:DNA polymerase I
MRRTDSFDLQSETLQTIFEEILDGDTDGALEHARETIARVKKGDAPVEKLVISRTVQEVEEDKISSRYKNPDSMANVQALRKTRKLGVEVVPGMKVSWVVTDSKAKPQRVEPYLDGILFEQRPDYNYYAERLSSTLSRVTEVFGISEKELLTGVQQASLFDSFQEETSEDEENIDQDEIEESEGSEERKTEVQEDHKDDKRPSSTMTLDDWM